MTNQEKALAALPADWIGLAEVSALLPKMVPLSKVLEPLERNGLIETRIAKGKVQVKRVVVPVS